MRAIGPTFMTIRDALYWTGATEGLAPLIRQQIWRYVTPFKQAGRSILVMDKKVDGLIETADHLTSSRGATSLWSARSLSLSPPLTFSADISGFAQHDVG